MLNQNFGPCAGALRPERFQACAGEKSAHAAFAKELEPLRSKSSFYLAWLNVLPGARTVPSKLCTTGLNAGSPGAVGTCAPSSS